MTTASRPSPAPAAAIALLALLAASCGGSTRRDDRVRAEVHELIRVGEFDEALRRAEEHRDARPDDAAATELHRKATVAWLMRQGQLAAFDFRLEEALAIFERAREIAPDSELVARWIDKTNLGIADEWLATALDLYADGDLSGAVAAYGAALDHVPGHPGALRGLEEVMILKNHREGKGGDYYIAGVNALSESWLDEARWKFTATGKYLPEYERAKGRRDLTEEMLADQRMTVAAGLEEDELYLAALDVYEQALRLDPANQEALDARERVLPEAQASRIISEAVMLVARERFDEALAQLDRAEGLTERQQGRIAELREEVATARLESVYQRALALEKDQRYPEAIEAYAELLDMADYYKDAQTRRTTLEKYIEMAADYYERAANEPDPGLRLEYLRAIRGFWSEYRDVAEQITELEATLPAEERMPQGQ